VNLTWLNYFLSGETGSKEVFKLLNFEVSSPASVGRTSCGVKEKSTCYHWCALCVCSGNNAKEMKHMTCSEELIKVICLARGTSKAPALRSRSIKSAPPCAQLEMACVGAGGIYFGAEFEYIIHYGLEFEIL